MIPVLISFLLTMWNVNGLDYDPTRYATKFSINYVECKFDQDIFCHMVKCVFY